MRSKRAAWLPAPAATVILANGAFPTHATPLAVLANAQRILCCDGAAAQLAATGRRPDAVVGDLDSLAPEHRAGWADCLVHDPGQNDNDLSKAFRHGLRRGWCAFSILGAAGLREDHTLGNLSLLADFAAHAQVVLYTDTGIFRALLAPAEIACFPGQQVSLFTFDPRTQLHAHGLRYPVDGLRLTRWWQATLNEAVDECFQVAADGGPVLVFQTYE